MATGPGRLTDLDEQKTLVSSNGPVTLDELHLYNAGSSLGVWVHIYDAAAAASVTVGTTVPAKSYFLLPTDKDTWVPNLRFENGIVIAAVREFHGAATGPATNDVNGSYTVR